MIVLVGLGLAGTVVLLLSLCRLPQAPACPTCGAVTREAEGRTWQWLTPVEVSRRACARCGWTGHMRWQWAADPAEEGGAG